MNEERNTAEEYRKLKAFIHDPMPIPWTIKELTGFRNVFCEAQKKALDDYLECNIENKESKESQKEFLARILEYKYRLDIKLGFEKPYRQGMFEHFMQSYQVMLDSMIKSVEKQLIQELQEESRDGLLKDIFEIAIRHLEENPDMQETIDKRYEQCVKFIVSPEIVPNSVQELLKANKAIGNPFEQIVDEKAINDIIMLNTKVQHNDKNTYREQCIRILAENYWIKMEYNKKIRKAGYLKIDAVRLARRFQDKIFEEVRNECCYMRGDERKVKAEYRDLDWDLLYNFVFLNLSHYMNKDVSEKLGILKDETSIKNFLLDIYDFYYKYYVFPAMKLKELQQDVCKEKLKELEDVLDKRNNLISDAPVLQVEDEDPYSAYIEIVVRQMECNKQFYKSRFVSEWVEFQNKEYGGLYVKLHPKKDFFGFSHFQKYPPKTMDEIYVFSLMLRLDWDMLKKLTSYIHKYYEWIHSNPRSNKYQSLAQKHSFITPEYRTDVLRTVDLENLSFPKKLQENSNDAYRRYKLIEWFFTEKPMIDFMQDKGQFSNASGLISYLNDILKIKGCDELPVGI